MSKLAVVRAGPLTSVQDAGRFGAQRYGLTSSGAMDLLALAAANTLVGNRGERSGDRDRSLSGAIFEARHGAVRLAITGAARDIKIAGRALPIGTTAMLGEGERLELGPCATVVCSAFSASRAAFRARLCSAASASPRAPASAVPSLARCKQATNLICSRPRAPANDVWCSIRRLARCFACLPGRRLRNSATRSRCSLRASGQSRPASDRMGYRLEGPKLVSREGTQHRLGRHGERQHSGSGQRPADRADARSRHHRRLSEDRNRHRPRSRPSGAAACRRERENLRDRHRGSPGRGAAFRGTDQILDQPAATSRRRARTSRRCTAPTSRATQSMHSTPQRGRLRRTTTLRRTGNGDGDSRPQQRSRRRFWHVVDGRRRGDARHRHVSANVACGFHAGDSDIMLSDGEACQSQGRQHRRASLLSRPAWIWPPAGRRD